MNLPELRKGENRLVSDSGLKPFFIALFLFLTATAFASPQDLSQLSSPESVFSLQPTATKTFITRDFSLPDDVVRLSDQSKNIGKVTTNKALLSSSAQIVPPPVTSQ